MAPPRLLLLSLVLAACSGDSSTPERPDEPGLALTARAPDERVEEHERLVPTAADGWGRHAVVGWHPIPWTDAAGRVGVATRGATAALALPALPALPALDARTRALELEMRAVHGSDDGEPGAEDVDDDDAAGVTRVAITLNETPLGSVSVDRTLDAFAFDTPTEAWNAGLNRLLLEITAEDVAASTPAVRVFGVSYGEDHRVLADVDAGTLTLEDRAEAVYLVERAEDGDRGRDLFVIGEARGDGKLVISYERLDPATGLRETVDELSLRASASDLEEGFWAPVPESTPAVLAIRLGWRASTSGTTVTLSRVFLREPSAAALPDVVFVSIDTLAAQNLSVYGYPRRTSPVLEEFAEEALVFTNCRSNAPWTVTSYASQLTGLYPEAHMLDAQADGDTPDPWERVQVAPSRWTLPELLRARGYATGGFVDNTWFRFEFGYDQGFDHFDTSPTLRNLHDPDGGIRLASANALTWLDEAVTPDSPFFLFVQALEPHAPYLPSAPFQGAFDGEDSPVPDIELEVGLGHSQSFGFVAEHVARGMTSADELPPTMNARAIADAYDERIHEVDTEIGKLFDELRARNLYEDAVIVVSADHGEAMGRHDMYFNHSLLYDEVTRVPLLIRLPGGEHGGRRVTTNVQLVDLYPTLSELAGVPARRFLHGRSLLDEGLWEEAEPSRGVYAMGGLQDQRSIVAGRWKLIVSNAGTSRLHVKLTHPRLPAGWLEERSGGAAVKIPGTAEEQRRWLQENRELARELNELLTKPYIELYDLVDDPDEQVNVAVEHPELVRQLLLELAEEQQRSEEARQWARFDRESLVLDEGSLTELGKLGYVGDE